VSLPPEELAFRARALAQAHPLSAPAKRFVDHAVGVQRTSQPLPEIGIWAGAALINGYCLRRVEEDEAGRSFSSGTPRAPGQPAADGPGDLEALDTAASTIAADLRAGDPKPHLLGSEECIFAALDRIIGSEVERRLDHWRDTIDDRAWAELEEYITWWVVKGYALRIAESSLEVCR
jgi:hypothetical protein